MKTITNDNIHQVDPPIAYKSILLDIGKQGGPMFATAVSGTLFSFTMLMTVSSLNDDDALAAWTTFTSIEWLMTALSAGNTVTAIKISAQAAACKAEEDASVPKLDTPNWALVGKYYRQGALLCVANSVVYNTLLLTLPYSLPYIGYSDRLVDAISAYARIYTIGVLGYNLADLSKRLMDATKQNSVAFIVQTISCIVGNAVAYAAMNAYEKPATNQLQGVAWGWVTQYWFNLLAYLVYFSLNNQNKKFKLFKLTSFDWASFKDSASELWATAKEAAGVQFFVATELSVITGITALGNKLSELALIAMNIAMAYLSLMVVPLFIAGDIAALLTSAARGRNRMQDILRIGNTVTMIGIASQLLMGLCFMSMPEPFIDFLSPIPVDNSTITDQPFMPTPDPFNPFMDLQFTNSSATFSPVIIETTTSLGSLALRGVCLVQIFDAIRLITAGALRGLDDVNLNVVASLLTLIPCAIGLSYLLAFGTLDMGLTGILLGRGIALVLNASFTGGWWLYKATHPAASMKELVKETGFFPCFKTNLEAQSLINSSDNIDYGIQADPARRATFPVSKLDAEFEPPIPCFKLFSR